MAQSHAGPTRLSAAEIASATTAIARAVDSFKPGGQVTVQLISSAFAAVRRVAELRRYSANEDSAPREISPQRDRLLTQHHAVLKEWNQLLPRVHGWLLAEKARLEAQRVHAFSVNTWLEANQQTR